MATRTVKSDSGNNLKLQNNGGTGSVTITDAGDLTIDSPADIVLDAEGADITLKDGGTTFGTLKQSSGHLVIQPTTSKQIILNEDGGAAALTVETNGDVTVETGDLVFGTAGKGVIGSGGTKVGQFTFDQSDTGAITPSIGFEPTWIEYICFYGTTLTPTYLRSHGWAFNNSSTSQYVQHAASNTMQLDWCISTDDSAGYDDSHKNELKVTAWTSDGPTLTHTKTGTPNTIHTVVFYAHY